MKSRHVFVPRTAMRFSRKRIGEVLRDAAADHGGRAVPRPAHGFDDAVVEVAERVGEGRHRRADEALERVPAAGDLPRKLARRRER